jgi:hypothetical protein
MRVSSILCVALAGEDSTGGPFYWRMCFLVTWPAACLESAVKYHSILPRDSDSIWMAIDFKAKKPVPNGLNLRFVRFSGQALAQGVVNTKIDGVPVRIYSAAKTNRRLPQIPKGNGE